MYRRARPLVAAAQNRDNQYDEFIDGCLERMQTMGAHAGNCLSHRRNANVQTSPLLIRANQSNQLPHPGFFVQPPISPGNLPPNLHHNIPENNLLSSENESFQEALDRLFQLVCEFCMYLLTTISRSSSEWIANNPIKAILGAVIGIILGCYVLAPTAFVSGVFSVLTSIGIPGDLLISAGTSVCAALGVSITEGAILSQVTACSIGATALIAAVCELSQAIIDYVQGNSPNVHISETLNNQSVLEINELAIQHITGPDRERLRGVLSSDGQAFTAQLNSFNNPSSSSSSSSNSIPVVSSNPYTAFTHQPSTARARTIVEGRNSYACCLNS